MQSERTRISNVIYERGDGMTEEEKKDFEKRDAETRLRQEELRALYGTRLFMLKTEWGYLGGSACINDCFTAPCGYDPESNTVTPHCDESGAVTWPALFGSRAVAEEAAADYAMVYREKQMPEIVRVDTIPDIAKGYEEIDSPYDFAELGFRSGAEMLMTLAVYRVHQAGG